MNFKEVWDKGKMDKSSLFDGPDLFKLNKTPPIKITSKMRHKLFENLILHDIDWYGSYLEDDFFGRIFDLSTLPSTDGRFDTAAGDIWQHRVNNHDWDDLWFLTDNRFNLANVEDDLFLRFLCEVIHPLVRPDAEDAEKIKKLINEAIEDSGFELHISSYVNGKPIYTARKIVFSSSKPLESVMKIADKLSAEYLSKQITRMEVAIDNDPELAIGTAKELIETICKSILDDKNVEYAKKDDLNVLVKKTLKELKLTPDNISDGAKGVEPIKILLNNLSSIVGRMAEIRNLYGTGHGKSMKVKGLESRHAKLVVGAATTIAVFIYETYEKQ